MYCTIDKDHLMKLISFLYDDVISAGGDGDVLWYSRYYNIKDIFPLIQEFNSKLEFPWAHLKLNDNTILWQDNEESVTITNNKEYWDNQPSWQQIAIKY